MALGGTALLSILLGDSQFSFSLIGGVSLVICSVFLYTLNPPKSPTLEVPNDEKLLMDEDSESSEEDDDGKEEIKTFLDYKKSECLLIKFILELLTKNTYFLKWND